jgi:hypothetical protein
VRIFLKSLTQHKAKIAIFGQALSHTAAAAAAPTPKKLNRDTTHPTRVPTGIQ